MKPLFFIAMLGLSAVGCDSVDNAIDCDGICSRYRDCFDSGYDTGACASRCRSNSKDKAYEAKVNSCNACIDAHSCTGAAFSCADDCSSVVP